MDKLGSLLRQQRVDCAIRQAQTIRGWPEGVARDECAARHAREARLQRVLGNITQEEEYRIFSILSFVMPADAPAEDDRPPLDPAEQPQADAEQPQADTDEHPLSEHACFLGCPACDGGGRMTDGIDPS